MADPGEVERGFFDEYIYPNLGADRDPFQGTFEGFRENPQERDTNGETGRDGMGGKS